MVQIIKDKTKGSNFWNYENDTAKVSNSIFHDLNNYKNRVDQIYRNTGLGGSQTQLISFLSGIDRYNQNIVPANRENVGYTFITRPKLNLSTASLMQDRLFMPLLTDSVNTIPFMIRCLLDTRYTRLHRDKADQCALLDTSSPFLTPVVNCLMGITGYPDPVVTTETTQGGYHSEDQTYAIGSDGLRKSYDFTLSFKDIQGGPIISIFEYWIKYIELVTDGRITAYIDDIDLSRINYTVSIYRFIMDPSNQYITRYAKSTGCFPKSVPIGSIFNTSEGDATVTDLQKFSIPFSVNNVTYNDYANLLQFRILMERYSPGLHKKKNLPSDTMNNYIGLPYIDNDVNGNLKLVFKDPKGSNQKQVDTSVNSLKGYSDGFIRSKVANLVNEKIVTTAEGALIEVLTNARTKEEQKEIIVNNSIATSPDELKAKLNEAIALDVLTPTESTRVMAERTA